MNLGLILTISRMSLVTGVLLTIWAVYSFPLVLEPNGDVEAADNVFLWVASASFAVDIFRNVRRLKVSKMTGNSNG